MKVGASIERVAEEVMRQDHEKQDLIHNTARMLAESDPAGLIFRCLDAAGNDLLEPLEISPIAHRQLGTYLGIPAKYYDKMQDEYVDLLAQNINGWFRKVADYRMVRTLDGQVRAFVSTSYRRIDHLNILQAVLPVMGEVRDLQFVSSEVTSSRLYLKAVNPHLEMEITEGDVVRCGVVITNSEIGQGSFCIKPMVFRVQSEGGFVDGEHQIRKIHRGRSLHVRGDEILEKEERLDLEDRTFLNSVQNLVGTAFDEAQFQDMVTKMRGAVGAVIERDRLEKVVELTSKAFGVTETESRGVLRYLEEGQDLTRYGLSNAVVRVSQDVEDYDRASTLEEIGYTVMVMPESKWDGLNLSAAG